MSLKTSHQFTVPFFNKISPCFTISFHKMKTLLPALIYKIIKMKEFGVSFFSCDSLLEESIISCVEKRKENFAFSLCHNSLWCLCAQQAWCFLLPSQTLYIGARQVVWPPGTLALKIENSIFGNFIDNLFCHVSWGFDRYCDTVIGKDQQLIWNEMINSQACSLIEAVISVVEMAGPRALEPDHWDLHFSCTTCQPCDLGQAPQPLCPGFTHYKWRMRAAALQNCPEELTSPHIEHP